MRSGHRDTVTCDGLSRPVLRAGIQPPTPVLWRVVARTPQVLPGAERTLPADDHAPHPAQPGTGRHGRGAAGLSMVQRAHASGARPRPAHHAASALSRDGNDTNERVQAYRRWPDTGITPDDLQRLRSYANKERAVGDERQQMVETTLGRPVACRAREQPWRDNLRDRIQLASSPLLTS